MKIRNYEIPRTLVIVSAVTGVALTFGAAKLFFAPADGARLEKKAALEAAKIPAMQLPVAAQCYDHILSAGSIVSPLATANTCKCLVSEVTKYAPGIQPSLSSLVVIGLKASANTETPAARSAFIKEAILDNSELTKLNADQAQVLQTGIKHVMKSCPMPSGQQNASLAAK